MEEATPYSVTVDREMCQTAAVCLAYHIYELDDDGKAVLLSKQGLSDEQRQQMDDMAEQTVLISDLINPEGKTPEEIQALVLESAKICPFNAIIVRDKEGNVIWPV